MTGSTYLTVLLFGLAALAVGLIIIFLAWLTGRASRNRSLSIRVRGLGISVHVTSEEQK